VERETHPWAHGATGVRGAPRGERLDCRHVVRRSSDTAFRFKRKWVCLGCAVMRCPVCGPAGENVLAGGYC